MILKALIPVLRLFWRFAGRTAVNAFRLSVIESKECDQRQHESPIPVLKTQHEGLINPDDKEHDRQSQEKYIHELHRYSFTSNVPEILLIV